MAKIRQERRETLEKRETDQTNVREEDRHTQTSSPCFNDDDLIAYVAAARNSKSYDRIVELVEKIDIPMKFKQPPIGINV